MYALKKTAITCSYSSSTSTRDWLLWDCRTLWLVQLHTFLSHLCTCPYVKKTEWSSLQR